MKVCDAELIEVLNELRGAYPDWRLGQMLCNVATWAKGAGSGAIWDMEDSEFIQTARDRLKHRANSN